MLTKDIKAVIFDLDGVIFDSQPVHYRVDLSVLALCGVVITQDELEPYAGTPNAERWAKLKDVYNLGMSAGSLIEAHNRILYETIEKEVLPICDGISSLLDKIKNAGLKTAVASSSSRRFVETTLVKAGLLVYFDILVCGDEINNGKPAPDIFLKAASFLNVKPNECIVIEDTKNGVTAANAAGMKCIGYQNKTSGCQDLSQATFVISRHSDFPFQS